MAISKDTKFSVKFEKDLHSLILDYAQANEMDGSKVIRLAVKKFLGYSPTAKSLSKKAKA